MHNRVDWYCKIHPRGCPCPCNKCETWIIYYALWTERIQFSYYTIHDGTAILSFFLLPYQFAIQLRTMFLLFQHAVQMFHSAIIVSTCNREKHHPNRLPQWLEKKLLSAIIIIRPRTSSFGDKEPAPQFITSNSYRN